ncbi:hypothetical protein GGI07_004161 [Coemansia sp. Benny D115]|nr:hypothetical protein GGI07_004161 [Coemansia sp. Benny D115]
MHNISLTPEYPEYRSSDWYMESTSNEHIVAVGIYYYDIENVTESRIEFREAVKNKMDCLKEYATTFHKIYGIFKDPNTKSEVLEQKTGHVDIKPGQYIASGGQKSSPK